MAASAIERTRLWLSVTLVAIHIGADLEAARLRRGIKTNNWFALFRKESSPLVGSCGWSHGAYACASLDPKWCSEHYVALVIDLQR